VTRRIPWESARDRFTNETRTLPLGRHVHHDPRSREFAVQQIAAAGIRSVNHRRLVPIYDQDQDVTVGGVVYHGTGSCTAHACRGALSTAPFRHKYRSESAIITWYKEVTKIDPFDGAFPPDDTGSDGLTNAQLAKSKGLISSYSHSFSLAQFVSGMQAGPAMIGVNWYDSFDRPGADGLVSLTPGAQVRGGHEMEVTQLLLATEGNYAGSDRVKIPQSWGRGFGVNGWIYMTLDTLARLLSEQGDATFMHP
jgi:hypothetical protein